jgi:hypothetical protein
MADVSDRRDADDRTGSAQVPDDVAMKKLPGRSDPYRQRGARGRLVGFALSVSLVVLLGCGCGRSGSAGYTKGGSLSASPPSVCLPGALEAMVRFLNVPAAKIALAVSTGNNAMPQCSFSAGPVGNEHVYVTANVDSAAQPYFVLERTAIEASQQFTTDRIIAAALPVAGLGLEADWFPAQQQLMATDGVRLITVSVHWRGAGATRERKLAAAVTRPYLRRAKSASPRGVAPPSNIDTNGQ